MKKRKLYTFAGTATLTTCAVISGFSSSFAEVPTAHMVAAAPTSANVATSDFTMDQALETLYQSFPEAAVHTITVEDNGDYYVWMSDGGKEIELMITTDRKIVQLPA